MYPGKPWSLLWQFPVLEKLVILLQLLEICSYMHTSDYMHICQSGFLFLCVELLERLYTSHLPF